MPENEEESHSLTEKERDLEKVNAEMIARLKNLKERFGEKSDKDVAVQDLKKELDTSIELKKTLEAELAAARAKAARRPIERDTAASPTEPESASDIQAAELHNKVSLAEQERDKAVKSLADAKTQIKTLQEELRWHLEKTDESKTEIKKLRNEKAVLEKQLGNTPTKR